MVVLLLLFARCAQSLPQNSWVQLPPIGAQMPQLSLQQNSSDPQTVSPQDLAQALIHRPRYATSGACRWEDTRHFKARNWEEVGQALAPASVRHLPRPAHRHHSLFADNRHYPSTVELEQAGQEQQTPRLGATLPRDEQTPGTRLQVS